MKGLRFLPFHAVTFLLLLPAALHAQTDSLQLLQLLPRNTTTYQVGLGSSHVLDTYLSQEKFSGTGLTLLATTEREKPGKRWTTFMEHQVNLASTHDRSDTQSQLQGDYTLLVGRLYQWQLPHRWTVQAGGALCGNIGFIYNTSNSNNPAQARLSASVMPTVTVSKRMQLFHRHLQVRYELNVPLVGIMFSPNYGQSYYEIFSRGNYDHNIVPTTFVSAPTFRQQLTVRYSISNHTAISLGYLGDYQQTDVNQLKTHIYSHRLMLGIVRQFSIINHRL